MTRRLAAAYTSQRMRGTYYVLRHSKKKKKEHIHYLFKYGSIDTMPLKRKYYAYPMRQVRRYINFQHVSLPTEY